MRQNLWWAFIFNVVGIALAFMGKLNPVMAALAMTLSSLIVVGNSLRLGADGGDTQLDVIGAAPLSPLEATSK